MKRDPVSQTCLCNVTPSDTITRLNTPVYFTDLRISQSLQRAASTALSTAQRIRNRTYVDFRCRCFDDGHLTRFVTCDVSRRWNAVNRHIQAESISGPHTLQDRARVQGANRDTGEKRGKEEVVLRTDNDLDREVIHIASPG